MNKWAQLLNRSRSPHFLITSKSPTSLILILLFILSVNEGCAPKEFTKNVGSDQVGGTAGPNGSGTGNPNIGVGVIPVSPFTPVAIGVGGGTTPVGPNGATVEVGPGGGTFTVSPPAGGTTTPNVVVGTPGNPNTTPGVTITPNPNGTVTVTVPPNGGIVTVEPGPGGTVTVPPGNPGTVTVTPIDPALVFPQGRIEEPLCAAYSTCPAYFVLSKPTEKDLTFSWATDDKAYQTNSLAGQPNVHYVPKTGTVTFKAGEDRQMITIQSLAIYDPMKIPFIFYNTYYGGAPLDTCMVWPCRK